RHGHGHTGRSEFLEHGSPPARERAWPRSRRPLRSRIMNRIFLAIGALIIVLLVVSSSLFVVDQRQVAVIKTFGEIKEVITEPGLNFNWPLVQTVSMLDKRIQTLDNPSPSAIFTAEKKSLVIDWLVKWRINDPRQYIRNNGVEQRNLENRLAAVAQAAFNEEVTKH